MDLFYRRSSDSHFRYRPDAGIHYLFIIIIHDARFYPGIDHTVWCGAVRQRDMVGVGIEILRRGGMESCRRTDK